MPEQFAVVRIDLPLDAPSFDSAIGADPALSLQVCRPLGDDAAVWQPLERAHLYHVSSARDDLPAPWFVNAALLQPPPACTRRSRASRRRPAPTSTAR